ncbi:DUF1559 domain-containing protein [Roseiconus lacunae]|uniref:DUF1559 domain-containing protein n=1 Tax=Roseiconus lacunae TaxID=2605694 RepID=UPI003091257F|nr:DUF1559 domain-containing protein [Stieleria sp. HD01]
MNQEPSRLVNVLMVLIGGLIFLTILPGRLLEQRGSARAARCATNLRQIALACQNYGDAFKQLPPGTGGTWSGKDPARSNQGRLGSLVGLLPFLDEQSTWEQIAKPYQSPQGRVFPAMGPTPTYNPELYPPWAMAPSMLLCPASAKISVNDAPIISSLRVPTAKLTLTSYVASFGDGTTMQGEVLDPSNSLLRELNDRRLAANRGMFMTGKGVRQRDCTDGLSNTILYSETIASLRRVEGQSEIIRNVEGLSKQPSRCLETITKEDRQFWKFGRGARWCDGWPLLTGFQTVLPPNSPSCTSTFGPTDPVVSANSLHAGGIHVVFCDGATLFVTDDIDCGDLHQPGVAHGEDYTTPGSESPYGLWGALGSRAAQEALLDDLSEDRSIQSAIESDLANQPRPTLPIWTDNQTGDQLVAEFIEVKDQTTLRLRHTLGSVHEVPLNSLIPADIHRAVELDLLRQARIELQSH